MRLSLGAEHLFTPLQLSELLMFHFTCTFAIRSSSARWQRPLAKESNEIDCGVWALERRFLGGRIRMTGKYAKLKTNLKVAIQRLKLLEKKKTENARKSTKEIADLIQASKSRVDRVKRH